MFGYAVSMNNEANAVTDYIAITFENGDVEVVEAPDAMPAIEAVRDRKPQTYTRLRAGELDAYRTTGTLPR
jgi:hypothetical protein